MLLDVCCCHLQFDKVILNMGTKTGFYNVNFIALLVYCGTGAQALNCLILKSVLIML